jgi:glycosyltransferase 2 family protein
VSERNWTATAKRAFKVLFFPAVVALAGYLIWRITRQYELDEVLAAIGAIPPARLALALGFAALSYLCLTGFDWLAVRYVGRPLPWRKARWPPSPPCRSATTSASPH